MPRKTKSPKRSIEKTSGPMFFKPCVRISKKSPKKRGAESREEVERKVLVEPCETIPKGSLKKRRVKSREVEREEVSTIKIEVGEHVDLKALLSSKDRNFLVSPKDDEKVPISSLDGKYVLVCGFFVPYHYKEDPQARACRSIQALYSELSLQGIADNVKLVVVVKMAPDSGISEFSSFFSKLSVDCLAIPFLDFKSRDNLCESLDVSTLDWSVPCLAVHPDGKVLQLSPFFLDNYGARSFPFTEEHFDSIIHEDEEIKLGIRSTDSPISLGELLQCDSLSQIGDENKSIPTSDLEGTTTPVGLYLCYDGFKDGFMDDLQNIYQKCLNKGRKFEIVVVPIPFGRDYDPKSFYNRVKKYALKDSRSSSWWAFPFNEKVCRTLWRIFHRYPEDQLIILPHVGHLGDLWGRQVASLYDGIDTYPFTRDVIVERKVRDLRSVTLGQLLGDTFMSQLENKNVVLYLDYPTSFFEDNSIFRSLNVVEREFQVKYPDVEVVFVPFEPVLRDSKRLLNKKGWHLLPPEVCECVVKHIFMIEAYPDEGVRSTLVTFDKDGRILSRSAHTRLPQNSTCPASLFDDTLGAEILNEITLEILRF